MIQDTVVEQAGGGCCKWSERVKKYNVYQLKSVS